MMQIKTVADRERPNFPVKHLKARRLMPWEYLLRIVLNDIKTGDFTQPFKFETVSNGFSVQHCLLIRSGDIKSYVDRSPFYARFCQDFKIKSVQELNKAIKASPVFFTGNLERMIDGKRIAHMDALSVDAMQYLCKLPN